MINTSLQCETIPHGTVQYIIWMNCDMVYNQTRTYTLRLRCQCALDGAFHRRGILWSQPCLATLGEKCLNDMVWYEMALFDDISYFDNNYCFIFELFCFRCYFHFIKLIQVENNLASLLLSRPVRIHRNCTRRYGLLRTPSDASITLLYYTMRYLH